MMCDSVDIESLKAQAKEFLNARKNSKDDEERRVLFNEYAKVYSKIRYYSDDSFKEMKLEKNKAYYENQYKPYNVNRKEYYRQYYLSHKPKNTQIVV